MYAFLIIFILTTYVFTTDLDTDVFQKQKGLTCLQYTDCFNCTLQGCGWEVDRCSGSLPKLTADVESIFTGGQSCGDPLGLCNKIKTNPNSDDTMTQYSFTPGVTIPSGYFCLMRIERNQNNGFFTLFWHISETDEEKQGIIYHNRYRSQSKDDKNTARLTQTDDFKNTDQMEQESSTSPHGYLFSKSASSLLQVGIISYETRTGEEARTFSVTVESLSSGEYFSRILSASTVVVVLVLVLMVTLICGVALCYFF